MQSRLRRRHIAVLMSLALSIAVAALAAGAPVATAQPSWCRPWAFVGVPGSNQGQQWDSSNPWGPEVESIHDSFVNAKGPSQVMNFPIAYPAEVIPTSVPDAFNDPWPYDESRAEGLREIKRVMNVIVDTCPNARIVLAGYSQGAEIASRIVNFAGWAPRARIYRVALIGNPVYNPENDQTSVKVGGSGFPAVPAQTLFPKWGQKVTWDAFAASRIKDVCIDDDIACDTLDALSGRSLRNPFEAHGQYRSRRFPGQSTYSITEWLGSRYLSGAWQPS